ncbi:MAG: ferric iron uptake transcriptional regulator [Candidatus Porifericomitaceae bacterium WSBS_2022_MAG_OTU9]
MKAQDLRKVGLRATTPRLHVVQALESSSQRHLSAEDIHNSLSNKGLDIGYATIYRVLTQLTQAGITVRHLFDSGSALYELADSDHHDHMICMDSGKVIEFQNEYIERMQQEIAKQHGYELVDHSLILYVRPLDAKKHKNQGNPLRQGTAFARRKRSR